MFRLSATRMLALLAFSGSFSGIAAANPISVSGAYLLLDDKGANDLGFTPGVQIGIGASSAVPNGSAGTTAVGTTVDLSSGATFSMAVPFAGGTANPNEFRGNTSLNANLTGPWTLTFTNGADAAVATTGSLIGVTPAPFATNVTISGSGLNPTFSWTYPAGGIDGVTLLIYDKSRAAAGGSADLVFSRSLPGTTGSFTLPNALAGGLTLTPGDQYVVDLKGLVLRNPIGGLTNPNTAAQTQSYSLFKLTFFISQIRSIGLRCGQ